MQVSKEDDAGCTALHHAAANGHVGCMRSLMAAGATVGVGLQDSDCYTAIV